MQAAILAGGLGTRLRPLTTKIPKAMVSVNGHPFLEYELELLERNGVNDVVLCLGYLGEQIEKYFGEGRRFGVKIRYSYDGKEPLGPIGALKMAESLLRDDFFVTYGDAYLRLDYHRLMEKLLKSGKLGVMAVYRNEKRFGKSDIMIKDGFVTAYDKQRNMLGMDWVNFGVTALSKGALGKLEAGQYYDEESFYEGMVKKRQLLAFEVYDRFYEIGSEQSLREFDAYIKTHTGPEQGYIGG